MLLVSPLNHGFASGGRAGWKKSWSRVSLVSIRYGWRITEWWFSRKAGSDSAEEAHTGSVPKTPKFETEAEEAQWWFDHRDEISDEFIRRAAEGTLGEGTLGRALQRQKARAESEQSPELSGLQAK
jgi:hypothetical protein